MSGSKEVNKAIANIYALTPLQEGMLFHYIAENGGTGYVVQNIYQIVGVFEETLVGNALHLLSERYDVLRTAIVYEGMTNPKQIVMKDRRIEYEFIDLKGYENEYAQEVFNSIKTADVNRGFDLQKDALLRVKFIRIAEQEYKMIWCFHHIIMDGWCLSLIYGEFLTYYDKLRKGMNYNEVEKSALSEKSRHAEYSEYIKWLKKKDKSEGLHYWSNLLKDFEGDSKIIPYGEKVITINPMERIGISFDKEIKEKIYEMAAACRVTFNTIVEAAWGIVLQRYCNTNDILYGKVVSGRDVNIPGIEQIVGLFINTIPFRVICDATMTVKDLLNNLFEQSTKSNEYSYCALSDIQNQTKLGSELIQSIFAFENYYVDENIINQKDNEYKIEVETVREQTNYGISASANLEDGIFSFNLMYNPGEYSEKEIVNILHKFKKIITTMVYDINQKIVDIECITDEEKKIVLEEFNSPLTDYVCEQNVINYLENTVKQTPEKIALIFENKQLTYFELNQKVNQLAQVLRNQGISGNDFVAIIAEKSMEMIIAIYAVLKAGGAYVPISPSYSESRIHYIVNDCKPKVVLTDGYFFQSNIPLINLLDVHLWDTKVEKVEIRTKGSDLAYCIYTSGTTGNPKGVMIEHKSLMNLCFNIENILYSGCNESITGLIADYVFDASVKMIFTSIIFGHTLCIISDELKNNVSELKNYIATQRIAILDGTPTYFKLLNKELNDIHCIRRLIVGGEELTNTLVKSLIVSNPQLEIINVYGPTETTVDATYLLCNQETQSVTIGKPIKNVNVYIVDKENHLCGIGVPGEICIAGVSVARGYLNKKELTETKFVKNPFGIGRMYHSGDIGKWRIDGTIEYIGRVDEQVKIRGFRIELGEIENVILRCKNISDGAVVVKEDTFNEKIICAYVVSEFTVDLAYFREELLKELPNYMIPTHIMQVDQLPLTRNGKLDKKALPDIAIQLTRDIVAPTSNVQIMVAAIFEKILGIDNMSIKDTFFELGGDSIKAIRAVSKIREAGYQITVKDIIKKQTVEAIAATAVPIEDSRKEEKEEYGVVINTPIIQEFIDRNLAKPEHYNHSVMIKVDTIDEKMIIQALDKLYNHHDILRSVLRHGQLEILQVKECRKYDFQVYDLRESKQLYEEIEEIGNKYQKSINLEVGPLIKTVFFLTNQGNYLMICIHHLVVDGVSWRILLEDFDTAIKSAVMRKEIKLPKKTDSFITWAQALEEYKSSHKFRQEYIYWKNVVSDMKSIVPFHVKNNPVKGYDTKEIIFDKEETYQVFYEAPKSFNTEAGDLLLCALAITMKQVFDAENIMVGLEGHGREEIHKTIKIDRTVGWFTSKYPVMLKYNKDMQYLIVQTKEMLRAIPNHGMGYGLMNEELEKPPVSLYFNYLGMSESTEESCPFSTGCDMAKENDINGLMILNSIVEAGKLIVSVVYDKENIQEDMILRFLKDYKQNVGDIIDFCTIQQERIVTASDCAQTDLSMDDFSSITEFMSFGLDM